MPLDLPKPGTYEYQYEFIVPRSELAREVSREMMKSLTKTSRLFGCTGA